MLEKVSFSPLEYVFAILTVDQECKTQTFEVTGFCVASGLLVTCWHCVRAKLRDGISYAALYAPNAERGPFVQRDLSEIAQDQNGSDLATATIQHRPPRKLYFNENTEVFGADVWTFGYPTSGHQAESGDKIIIPRLLKGYVTRTFQHNHPGFGATRAIEADMPAPAGLSGAPLFRA
ncbi:MAG: S1 family peptidase, partial [Bryobacteraceae bacterium]